MTTVKRIKVDRSFQHLKLPVGDDRRVIGVDDRLIVAAEYIDVRRHVLQMARVRHEAAQPVSHLQRYFGIRRHLHQVDIHVEQTGMPAPSRVFDALQGRLEHFFGFSRARAFSNTAGLQVP